MNKLFLIIVILIIRSFDINADNIKWKRFYDATKIEINKLPTNIQDSISKYSNSYQESIMVFSINNFLLTCLNVKEEFMYSENDRLALFCIDTNTKKFVFYQNTLSDYLNDFFYLNGNLYCYSLKTIKGKQSYTSFFLINKDSIDSCKEVIFKKQDLSRINSDKFHTEVNIVNNQFKIWIESYKQNFNYEWLLLWWAPRNPPDKWRYVKKSEENYLYTLDMNLNIISIEKENDLNKNDK